VDETRLYWIGFNRVGGVGAVRLRLLLDAFGDVRTAWHASEAELLGAGLDRRSARAVCEARRTIDLPAEAAKIEALGLQVLTWADDEYPERLLEIDAPPPVLYVRGGLLPQDRWATAVVGTRRPSVYGRSVARDLGSLLGAAGVTVVSGLARGIDAAAHEAALEAGGRTIAVMGCGLDRLYPPEHRRLAESIAGAGALMSDYPLGTPPEAVNFPPRNRIIAGLSLVVVIVEAGEGSGALITADFAADQGREVFSVPGSIYSGSSRGTNQLIAAGARPLVDLREVVEALNLDLAVRQEQTAQALPEDPTEARLLEALSAEPMHVDELRLRCDLPAAQVGAGLAMLELKGRVRQVGGMHYVRVREAGPVYKVE
jgi:DNA processing protein